MKKFAQMVLLVIGLCCLFQAFAVENEVVSDGLQTAAPVLVCLDGLRIPLEHEVVINGGIAYVPGEELFRAMGAQDIQMGMNGDGVHKVLSGVKNFDDGTYHSFYYTEGITQMVVDTMTDYFLEVDTPPQMIDGVIMLPLFLVDVTMNVTSVYNAVENCVLISSGNLNYADLSCQNGSLFLAEKYVPKQAGELEDNRIGGLWGGICNFSDDQLNGLADSIIASGSTRARVSLYPIDFGHDDCRMPETQEEARHDAFFTKLAENGVKDTFVLSFWDYAHRNDSGEALPVPRFQTQAEIDRYLEYARFTVNRFREQIQYFELWNEWNITGTEQSIELKDYINLAKQAALAIREVNADAKIVVGSIAAGLDPDTYSLEDLIAVLQSDVMPLVDVVCIEPLFGASPEFGADCYYGFADTICMIKTTAEENGFSGEYFCGPVNLYYAMDQPGAFAGSPIYTPMKVAKYYAREIVRYLALDLSIEVSDRPAEITRATVSNLCTIMAGTKAEAVRADVECAQTPLSQYGFSLPNGDLYIAVWWDGIAEDTDVQIPATLTLPDRAASSVTAIDPVYGFEQTLWATNTPQGVRIENLILRDYPLIIRLVP